MRAAMDSRVEVSWEPVVEPMDPRWDWCRALYAYTVGGEDEIAYIGKAGRCTVRERWRRCSKEAFWDALEKERRIFKHRLLVGSLALYDMSRYSERLLGDVESLLIVALKPWGNIMSTTSRVSRPGLEVRCYGSWPASVSRFRDDHDSVVVWDR